MVTYPVFTESIIQNFYITPTGTIFFCRKSDKMLSFCNNSEFSLRTKTKWIEWNASTQTMMADSDKDKIMFTVLNNFCYVVA